MHSLGLIKSLVAFDLHLFGKERRKGLLSPSASVNNYVSELT